LIYRREEYRGKRVTIMGLGLHGGGLSSAIFFLKSGAIVTITDLKKRDDLAPSLEKLNRYIDKGNLRLVLGRHREEDFKDTEMVIKNPGVPADSPFLRIAKARGIPIETDISVFLKHSRNPLIAVTGSKGKSTTAAAIHHGLKTTYKNAKLGGNITVSPLTFLDELREGDPIVLEVSSWQLADLRGNPYFKPKIAIVTNILPDHQNKYHSMEEYVRDKMIIVSNQNSEDYTILNFRDRYRDAFVYKTSSNIYFFSSTPVEDSDFRGGYLNGDRALLVDRGSITELFQDTMLKGRHNRLNLLASSVALSLFDIRAQLISRAMATFPGLEHRMEMFLDFNGIKFYNDSAATIPEATVEAVKSLSPPLFLITGGTDKKLDFSPFKEIADKPERIFLLAGSATTKIERILKEEDVPYHGPYPDLEGLVERLFRKLRRGIKVLFSPGCASFELFDNEFHRGRVFKELVQEKTR